MEDIERVDAKVCASKGCMNRGHCFLKLAIADLGGFFCQNCADSLLADGLVEEVKQ